ILPPLIALNNGTATLLYGGGAAVLAGNAAAATTARFGFCSSTGAKVDGFSLIDSSTVAISSETEIIACSSTQCINQQCGIGFSCRNCPDCQANNHVVFVTDTLHLSGGSVSCTTGGPNATVGCTGSPGGPALANRVSSAHPPAFVGLSRSSWVLTDGNGTQHGAAIGGLSSPTWPLIDGSPFPLVYLPGLGGVAGPLGPPARPPRRVGAGPLPLPVLSGARTAPLASAYGAFLALPR